MMSQGVQHAIGTEKFPAPQATLMAVLIKGILSQNLDWQYVFVGSFLAVVMELCGIKSLSFAVGAYLPLSTTLPIFTGGAIRGIVEWKQKKNNTSISPEEEELSKGSLFCDRTCCGWCCCRSIDSLLSRNKRRTKQKQSKPRSKISEALGEGLYYLLGVAFFAAMGWVLYRNAMKKKEI